MRSGVSSKKPERKLLKSLRKRAGRSNTGRITIRHRGGGHRKMYRMVDFGQEHMGKKGTVQALEYDPNRTSFIALMKYEDGSQGYLLAPQELKEGDSILCDEKTEPLIGSRMKLRNIPLGTMIYNIELNPGTGGVIVRGAGAGAKILAHEGSISLVQLPSTETRKVLSEGFASVGMVSNPAHRYHRIPKAGRVRNKGRRPRVRGSAMNPVDHPHGGGEGRAPIGLKYPKTPEGKHALGVKTRKKKWTDQLIVNRRKKNK